jgi:hypothetical protein
VAVGVEVKTKLVYPVVLVAVVDTTKQAVQATLQAHHQAKEIMVEAQLEMAEPLLVVVVEQVLLAALLVLVLPLVALVALVQHPQLQVPLLLVQVGVEAEATLQKALVALAVAAMEVKVLPLLAVMEQQTPEVGVVAAQH